MSGLVPGSIFPSSGFNRKSTPTPPNITPAELDNRYKKADFNGQDWPYDSPVAGSYDVKNTSTKLIILNNRYGKNGTRLRGYYTGPQKPDRTADPDRHRAKSPRNPHFHIECFNSSSPKFEPTVKADLEWNSSTHRDPDALSAKFSVNPNRHASCRISPDLRIHDSRPSSRMIMPPSRYFKEYADLTAGEKIYLWSIERIYNVDKMKQFKQDQYKKLLDLEAKKGQYGSKEYMRYMQYINHSKDRTYGTGSPSDRRSRSALSYRSRSAMSGTSTAKTDRSVEGKSTERPKTSEGRTDTSSDAKQGHAQSSTGQRQKSLSPYRSPSRKSSARSTRPASQQSGTQRSKGASRTSSAASAKYSGKDSKGGYSDKADKRSQHGEGKDRPKSRLGHPHPNDHDKDFVGSSMSSLRSDVTLTSSSSLRGNTEHETTADEGKTDTTKKQNTIRSRSTNSLQSSSIDRMGSRSSLSSRGSSRPSSSIDRPSYAYRNNTKPVNKTDTKIHRVPSEGYIDGDKTTGVAKMASDDTTRTVSESDQNKKDTQDENSDHQVDNKTPVSSSENNLTEPEAVDEVQAVNHKEVNSENDSKESNQYINKIEKDENMEKEEKVENYSETETTTKTENDGQKVETNKSDLIEHDVAKDELESEKNTSEVENENKPATDKTVDEKSSSSEYETETETNSDNENEKPETSEKQANVTYIATKSSESETANETDDTTTNEHSSEDKTEGQTNVKDQTDKDNVTMANQTDDDKVENGNSRHRLSRQDSFDEGEERTTKDPDKLEY